MQDTTQNRPRWSRRRLIATTALLLLAVIGSMIHQAGPLFKWTGWQFPRIDWRLWEWYIEDAAISFAYARNWAAGDGLVAFAGGERIEGFSNPLWVALMALFYPLGIDGFSSSKGMAMFFGALTVLMVWRAAVAVIDDEDSHAPLLAPVFIALYPQFAFWNASGLENSLFSFMLAGGIWRTVVEGKKGGFPWSAVFFLGLSVTRPEGIMYAAWAGFLGMCYSLLAGRGAKPTLTWLGVFWVPFTLYHSIRYSYFAWVFPNTYYAKLGHRGFRPFAWGQRGWRYIREWAFDTNLGWFLPLFLTSITGLKGWRRWAMPVATVLAAICFVYPSSELTNEWTWWPTGLPNPSWWAELRVWTLFTLALSLPILAIGNKGWQGRVLCWGSMLITLFFCIRSQGDWMNGYRWLSFISAPISVMFAVAVYDIAGLMQRTLGRRSGPGWSIPGWLTVVVLTAAITPGFYLHSEAFFSKRETGPFSVKKRVQYTESLIDKLFLDGHVYNLDVDMGAHMYWSKHQMVDMAGLVDVTIAHHNYKQREVTREYVFDQRKPQIAHVHGGWASNSKIPTFDQWKSEYILVPGFGGKTLHMGNHIRRDLLMEERWRGPRERVVYFEDGFTLAGFHVPSAEISVGKALFIEVGALYRRTEGKEDVRLLAFISNEDFGPFVFDVPLGYDWLPPSEWKNDEVFHGRFAPVLPKELEAGLYDLGFLAFAADGSILTVAKPAVQPEEEDEYSLPPGMVVAGWNGVEPRVAAGEVRFESILRIGPPSTGERGAKADFDRAIDKATVSRCADAENHWTLAKRHIPRASKWHEEHAVELAPLMATCYADAAISSDDPYAAADLLARGRHWDRHSPDLLLAMEEIGAKLYAIGESAREEARWAEAFTAFDTAAMAHPSLSWARRYAEEARDYRLGIDEESLARADQERKDRLEKLRTEQERRKAEREAAAAEAAAGPEGEE